MFLSFGAGLIITDYIILEKFYKKEDNSIS